MDISERAVDLIVAWEVSGGDVSAIRTGYNNNCRHPHWPGNAASGLTIGIGYDLRFAARNFESDWRARLNALPSPRDAYTRLLAYVGRGGSSAAQRATRDISIPWEDALSVYRVRRLPAYIEEARGAFPGVEAMGPDVFGAITSLVYNCGTGTRDKPLKKAAYDVIRAGVANNDRAEVARGLRLMKLYHNLQPRVRDGLNRRREAEARLVEQVQETGAVARQGVSVG